MDDVQRQEALRIARETVEREAQAVRGLSGQLDECVADVAALLFDCQGHVLVTGAGTSGAVAQRFAHLLSCCGTPALFIHPADCLHGGAGAIKAQDVVFIISKGGHSAEINQLADIARSRGARLVALTEKPDSPLAVRCDVVLKIVAQAGVDLYGMIATGSSLVNSAACDALCAILLRMRGYTAQEFGLTHPGGAVGKMLAVSGVPDGTPGEAPV